MTLRVALDTLTAHLKKVSPTLSQSEKQLLQGTLKALQEDLVISAYGFEKNLNTAQTVMDLSEDLLKLS